jgi:zinc D-Ala-D-Ala dipeptidase
MTRFHEPLPDMTQLRERARKARAFPLNLAAQENSERAVDVRHHGIMGENYYHKESDNPPYDHRAPSSIPHLYVREGLLARLVAVNEVLGSLGYELYLFDAYRPVEVQNYFHDEWVPRALRIAHPEWSDEMVRAETTRYWAKGAPSADDIDPLSPPPHTTGGVVDLTLRSRVSGTLLFMGSAFDAIGPVAHVEYFERIAGERVLSLAEEEARMNRRFLFWVMHEAGLVNYPSEWWHFGYGDQLSALLSGAQHAVYSKMDIV